MSVRWITILVVHLQEIRLQTEMSTDKDYMNVQRNREDWGH